MSQSVSKRRSGCIRSNHISEASTIQNWKAKVLIPKPLEIRKWCDLKDWLMVRKGGLEPPRLAAPDPKLRRLAGVSEAGACCRNPEQPRTLGEGASKDLQRLLVRKGGLEPPRLAAPDPKSGASANSATFARVSSLYCKSSDLDRSKGWEKAYH